MSDFESRLKRLEDRAALHDLVVNYLLAVDNDDYQALPALFSADAVFSTSGHVAAEGRDAIIEFLRSARSQMGLTVHTPNYVSLMGIDGDHAKGLVGAHLELVLDEKAVFGAVRYEDEYVRRDGSWVFRRRDMRTIHIAPWNEISAAFPSNRPVRWPGIDPLPSDYPRKRS